MVPEADRAEHAALSDAFRASPEVVTIAEIGGATCFAIPRLAHRFFNRVIGLDSIEPVDEIAEFYGELPWWVYDVNGLGPALAERGFTDDYGFMKFSRGIGPREARSELRVDQVGEDRAADFARVVVGGFELPEWTEPSQPTSSAAPGGRATSPTTATSRPGRVRSTRRRRRLARVRRDAAEYRGRGAQSAILAARIEDARRQGCATVVTETGELADDRPSSSYRNILRAGFREAGVRPNYRAA